MTPNQTPLPSVFSPLAKALLDAFSEGVVVFDGQGKILYANQPAREIGLDLTLGAREHRKPGRRAAKRGRRPGSYRLAVFAVLPSRRPTVFLSPVRHLRPPALSILLALSCQRPSAPTTPEQGTLSVSWRGTFSGRF